MPPSGLPKVSLWPTRSWGGHATAAGDEAGSMKMKHKATDPPTTIDFALELRAAMRSPPWWILIVRARAYHGTRRGFVLTPACPTHIVRVALHWKEGEPSECRGEGARGCEVDVAESRHCA